MDRYWLLTWTTDGTWLPGDERGWVGPQRVAEEIRRKANEFQTESHAANLALQSYARSRLRTKPVFLTTAQAGIVLTQFQETAAYRSWKLVAAAVLENHVHLVVGVMGDPDPHLLLRDFKSYGSRALNRLTSGGDRRIWWTESGSTRKLPDEIAVVNATRYVLDQSRPLVVWPIGERGDVSPPGDFI